ncbi:MAG: transcriptional regulator [Candidatus Brocadiae bacterium]|nr:transcriptional regulator [Candidatus Brocadiia bacterium]
MGKDIIPCILDNTPLPALLQSRKYFDFIDFTQGIQELETAFSNRKSELCFTHPSPSLSETNPLINRQDDWSAQICQGATIQDLDPRAIIKARTEYKKKYPEKLLQIDEWDDITFLNKAKVTKQGKITYTAIILLGKEESEHFISPSIAKITWLLKNENNEDKDYQHFGPPFLLNSESVCAKIRNLTYRYLPNNSLFPVEVTQYEQYLLRETLHNCIAHQNYELKGRINVVEKPEELIFTNVGTFIPGSVEKVVAMEIPPECYRNPFLVTAMANLNMVDIIGSGIRKMFILQSKRFFPLPDYDLTEANRVKVRIFGKILDENYTRLLIRYNLDMRTLIALDKVQKKIKLKPDELKLLKSKKFIEGRRPNYFVSAKIAQMTNQKATYTKYKAFDKQYYQNLIKQFITQHKEVTRKEIEQLLIDKLPDNLDTKQRKNKINNLLNEMSNKLGMIKNIGSRTVSRWVLL